MEIGTGVGDNTPTISSVSMPPQLGALLTDLTDIPDTELALQKVIAEYLELKCQVLEKRITAFEKKWNMSFEQFSQKCAKGTLAKDVYSYEAEKDFWEWEQAVTLQHHYESLRPQWM